MEQAEARRIFSGGLADFMSRKGHTLDSLAKILGIKNPSVSVMKSGKTLPTFDKVFTLAENGMALEEIFGAELAQKLAADYQRTAVRKEPLTAARQAKEILKLLLKEVEKMPGGDQ